AELHVYPERMQQNMQLTRGLIFSQKVLLALNAAGLSREAAYDIVQRNAMATWAGTGQFREALENDPAVGEVLDAATLDACFDAQGLLQNAGVIFDRVFADE
ncbi:MAG: adenylosuccinate lyase, partial [Acidobacteria bacterium]|nr:adenylosuccinate lyase [Acidobacteriota bacterium]NIO59598.1 adenylosuccinate lyase [Acidobacteriota bacterium]NIQ30621.1 adenylosuccinate lyase [Acidobacteriota bacterium]NIT11304.1 adenylosuccinate lyase [Acidobacteriota bacterium]